MTKKDLKSYTANRAEILQIRRMIETLEARATAAKAPAITGLPKGGKQESAVEKAAVTLVDLKAIYAEKLRQLEAKQAEIEKAITALESIERQLIRARYLEGLKWDDVCLAIGYSWQQTHRIHKRALVALEQEDKNAPLR